MHFIDAFLVVVHLYGALLFVCFSKFSILYFVYFALLGVLAPYLSLYLDEQGFSLLEIGHLMSLLMLTKIAAPLLWGTLADKYNKSVFLVRFGSLATLLSYLGFFWVQDFWSYALVIILFSFFWNAVLPQIEVLTMYSLAERRNLYSRIRLWGSVGFILSVVAAGWLFGLFGISLFPWVLLLVIGSIFVASLQSFKDVDLSKSSQEAKIRFVVQLRQPKVILFFWVSCLLQVSHGVYYTYFSIYMEAFGYSKLLIGGLWALGVVAEVAMFVVMHRWLKQHSIEKIMLLSLLITALRWLMTGFYADVLWLILLLQCLHAFSFGAMHVASIHFVHKHFVQLNQGRAQALYSSVGFGAGGALGAFLSAFIVSAYGYIPAFVSSAVICVIAILLVLKMMTYDKASENS